MPGELSRALQGWAVFAAIITVSFQQPYPLIKQTTPVCHEMRINEDACSAFTVCEQKYRCEKHLENVLAEEKINLSLGYCGGGGCMAFEMVKLGFCGSDAQRQLQPDLVWVTEQLMMSKDSFDCHMHR